MNILITDIVIWLEVPGGLLKYYLQVNIKAEISSIDRERTGLQKGLRKLEEKNTIVFSLYLILLF